MSAYYNENDPFAAAWLRELMKDGLIAPGWVDERSIEDVLPIEIEGFTQCHWFAGVGIWSLSLRLAGWPDDRPLWTGSCPCQPFSAAGKGAGFDDERHLWPAWFHLITHGKRRDVPVLGEQVASKDGRAWFDLVSSDMQGLAHACGAVDTSAASLGAPFIGQRLYWLAASARSGQARVSGSSAAQNERVAERGADGGLAASDSEDQGGRGIQRPGEGDSASDGATCERPEGLRASHRLAPSDSGQREQQSSERRSSGLLGTTHGTTRQQQRSGNCGAGNIWPPHQRSENGDGIPLHPVDYWRDADWLLCRDPNGPRFRPVEPSHVIMVDVGAVGGYVVGSGRTSETAEQTQETVNNEKLQALQRASDPQNIPVRSDGIVVDPSASAVLQSTVHGGLAAGSHQGDVTAEQQATVGSNAETDMRTLRQSEETDACSPSQREPVRQHTEQSPDVVRFMSHALTLAQLRRDNATVEALQALRQAVISKGVMQHPSDTLETIWRSISDADQERIRLDHSFDRWKTVTPFPLCEKGEYLNRLAAVRGAGNALNISQATCFVEAVMGYLDQ